MFKLFEPFGVKLTNVNDVILSEEEIDLIEGEFIPLLEATGTPRAVSSSPNLNNLSKAIENREYLSVYYQDRDGGTGHRLVEPYALGRGFKRNGVVTHNNHYYLRVFVIMDSSADETTKGRFLKRKSVSVSNKRKRWRLFRVDGIDSMTNMKKKFSQYRKQYNPNDKQMGSIITSLGHNEFPKGQNSKINF